MILRELIEKISFGTEIRIEKEEKTIFSGDVKNYPYHLKRELESKVLSIESTTGSEYDGVIIITIEKGLSELKFLEPVEFEKLKPGDLCKYKDSIFMKIQPYKNINAVNAQDGGPMMFMDKTKVESVCGTFVIEAGEEK